MEKSVYTKRSFAFSIDKATAESNAKLVAKQKEVEGVFMPVMTKIYQSMAPEGAASPMPANANTDAGPQVEEVD